MILCDADGFEVDAIIELMMVDGQPLKIKMGNSKVKMRLRIHKSVARKVVC